MTMEKIRYIRPQVCIYEVHPAQMLALSIIQGGTADQGAEVLVKGNEWDIFGEDVTSDDTSSND